VNDEFNATLSRIQKGIAALRCVPSSQVVIEIEQQYDGTASHGYYSQYRWCARSYRLLVTPGEGVEKLSCGFVGFGNAPESAVAAIEHDLVERIRAATRAMDEEATP